MNSEGLIIVCSIDAPAANAIITGVTALEVVVLARVLEGVGTA